MKVVVIVVIVAIIANSETAAVAIEDKAHDVCVR